MNVAPFDSSGLLDYQARNAIQLCNVLVAYGGALDAGDTGIGKTYEIAAVMRHRNEAWLVVCPKSVRTAWLNVAEYLGGKCHVVNYEKLKGKNEWGEMTKPEGYDEAVRISREVKANVKVFRANILAADAKLLNPKLTQEERRKIREEWSPMEFHKLLQEEVNARKVLKGLKAQRRFVWHQTDIPGIVFDEGHRCKDPDSLNSKIMIAAKRQGIPCIVASATAAENPLDMKALGYVLGLHAGTDFWQWCKRSGCKPSIHGGLTYAGGAEQMQRIHRQIFPSHGVRTRRADVPNFPECQITAELYDMDDPQHIDALYAEMNAAMEALKLKSSLDVDLDHPLTQMLRARQQIELVKVPLFVELAEQAMDEGMSVAIFVNFDQTIEEIKKRLHFSVGEIRGGQTGPERDQAIEKFQRGETRIMLANLKAGGVGVSLHDVHGNFPRLALISPTFSALDLVQVLGRVWRQGSKSKALQRIVLAAGTVETHIHSRLKTKLNNISMLNDGDLNPLIA